MVRLWPAAAVLFPRMKAGKQVADWDGVHQKAMDVLERWLRSARHTQETAELGRVGLRSRERLKDAAGYLALHHLCVENDIQADDNQMLEKKARYFWEQAEDIWRVESMMLDYDVGRDGTIDDSDKNMAAPGRVIRG
jgi:hypothetical protein